MMVERRRSETWSADNITPLRPRAPPAVEDADAEADAGFTQDQVEVLGHALAGVKTELSDAFANRPRPPENAFEARLDIRADRGQSRPPG